MNIQEFSDFLATAEGRLIRETGASLYEIAGQIINLAMKNFTGDDRLDVKRTRNTKRGQKGSSYRSDYIAGHYIVSNNTGHMKGPRAITGNLRRSLTTKFNLSDPGRLQVTIQAGMGAPIAYAAPLEYGAPSRNILPRLYLGRAVMKVKDETVNKELLNSLEVALHRSMSKGGMIRSTGG